jgi:hypothetical protein
METALLKSFATWARTALIREVTARIAVVLAPASPERVEQPRVAEALEKAVNSAGGGDKGRAAVADRVAYTWFNRIIALRFMDANGYTGIGVVSPQAGVGSGQPEILAEAKRGNIDATVVGTKTHETVAALLNGTRRSEDPQGEAYALLLADYCRYWNRAMPFMFEREGDFTELLIPANLLADDSVLNRAVKDLTTDACRDVEVIGWLYQFYISERKDEVFAGFKKNKKAGATEIPAATQLFTPHWIVRYLVENSLGRLWMLNRPASRLIEQMDYYIPSSDEDEEFLRIGRLEELKVLDPACGSGHMLTYAFDLLYAIYEEEGYAPSDIPTLILSNNLHGTEIDPRAGALAAFALTMKARARKRRFFNEKIEPKICVIQPVRFSPADLGTLVTRDGDQDDERMFWNQFAQADSVGALVRPQAGLLANLRRHVKSMRLECDLLYEELLERADTVLVQTEYLTTQYGVVVANPPYMGSGNMAGELSTWVKENFAEEKQDLYGCFVTRGSELVQRGGLVAMVIGDGWIAIKTFEKFRERLLNGHTFLSFLHLQDVSKHQDTFGANTAFVFSKGRTPKHECTFVHLEPLSDDGKQTRLLAAIGDRTVPWAYQIHTDEFLEIPGAPFAYQSSEKLRAAFVKLPLVADVASPRQGLATANDARFLRMWYEVSRAQIGLGMASRIDAKASGRRWFPFNKGGSFRRWYGNIEHVVDWENDGQALLGMRPKSVIRNPQFYFQPAVGWSNVSAGAPAFRVIDEGVIFGHVGQSIFGDEDTRTALLAILNSGFGYRVLGLLAPTIHFEVGSIAKVPANLDLPPEHKKIVKSLVDIARRDWNTQETAIDFLAPEWVERRHLGSIRTIVSDSYQEWARLTERMCDYEEQINALVSRAYDIEDEIDPAVALERVALFNNPRFRFENIGDDEAAESAFRRSAAEDLVSYAVGCMVGRHSLNEPGLILADQGATVRDYLAKVPNPAILPDSDNVIPIVGGDWFEDDIVARFRKFLQAAFGEQHFEENLRFVTESLGVKDIRDYFVKSFYKDHVQRYKKRPIYWLFSSPRGSFNALIYMHRYTPSTVSTVLNEYLREFRAKLEASLQQQERLAAGGGTPRQQAAAQKEADRLRKVLLELEEYEHNVLYPLASRQLAIDLDDGVKANYPKFGNALKRIPGLEASDE